MNDFNSITRSLLRELQKEHKESPSVLVVEDDAADAYVMREWLSDMKCSVKVSGNGLEAFDMIQRTNFDIVFLDLNLPGIDGLEILRRMNTLAHHPHVVIVTGSDKIDLLPPTKYFGVVRKPLSRECMSDIVRQRG